MKVLVATCADVLANTKMDGAFLVVDGDKAVQIGRITSVSSRTLLSLATTLTATVSKAPVGQDRPTNKPWYQQHDKRKWK